MWPRWRVVADACSVTSASRAVAPGSSTPRSGWIQLYGARGFEGPQGTPGGGGDRGLAEYLAWAFLPVAGRCVAEECLEVCDVLGRPRVAARAEVMKHVIDGAGLVYDVAGC